MPRRKKPFKSAKPIEPHESYQSSYARARNSQPQTRERVEGSKRATGEAQVNLRAIKRELFKLNELKSHFVGKDLAAFEAALKGHNSYNADVALRRLKQMRLVEGELSAMGIPMSPLVKKLLDTPVSRVYRFLSRAEMAPHVREFLLTFMRVQQHSLLAPGAKEPTLREALIDRTGIIDSFDASIAHQQRQLDEWGREIHHVRGIMREPAPAPKPKPKKR